MALLLWLATSATMFRKIHFLMHPGYWVGWPLLMSGLVDVFGREMPIIWNMLALSLFTALFWLINPTSGVGHFDLFMLSVWSLVFVRGLFVIVYIYPETYFFPFNILSRWYKVPASVWRPIHKLDYPSNTLCLQCSSVTSSSKLIAGSYRPLVPLVEWHNVFVSGRSLDGASPYDLCPLIWHATGSQSLRNSIDEGWRIKIWQERPLSRHVFAKLYQRDKPIGVRLVIHRRKNFNDRKLQPQIYAEPSKYKTNHEGFSILLTF